MRSVAAGGTAFSDFEAIDSERGLEWRRAGGLSLRKFCTWASATSCRTIHG
jgi:hypothetical protein